MATAGTELASAYVSIYTKMPGVKNDINKALGGVDSAPAGARIGSKLTAGLQKAVKISAVAVGGVLAAAVVKGFGRLKAIENARASLVGLGHDSKNVDKIMENALNSVKGTAFGMDEAAKSAASAVAAGVKPGKDLERTLKLAGDAATIAGTDMGSMGAIFNKVAASNKVQMDVINQLHDAGVPALSLLADQLGVTAEEASKMASAGKIDFATFQDAMEKGLGGAALASGNTTSGAFDNMTAALSRFGAKLLEDVFPLIGPVFNSITKWLDKTAEGIEPVLSGFGGVFNLFKDGEFSASLREAFGWEEDSGIVTFLLGLRQTVIDVSTEVTGGVKAMVAAFQAGGSDVTSSGFAGVLERVGLAARGLTDFITQKLVPGLVDLGKWVIENKDWLSAIAVAVGSVVVGMKGWALAVKGWTAVSKVANAVQVGMTAATVAYKGAASGSAKAQLLFNKVLGANPIVKIVMLVMALVGALVYFFTQTETGKKVWAGFMGFLSDAWRNVTGFFKSVWENVLKPVFEGIGQVFKAVWENVLKPVFDAIASFSTWVFETILTPLFKLVQLHFAIMAGIFQGIWDFILKPVFDAIGKIFTWIFNTIIKPIINGIKLYVKAWGMVFTWLWANAVKPAFDSIGKIFNWIYQVIIKPTVDRIKLQIQAVGMVFSWLWANAVKPAIDNVGKIFNWLYQSVVKPVWDGIKKVIEGVWKNGIKPVIDTLSKVISTDPKKAFEAARDGIQTAWTAIQDLAKKPVKFVIETVINGLIDTINKIPGVNLKKVPLPKGFAQGGVLPGYNAQKKDTILTPMRAGEGVLVPEVVRGLGAGFVHGLNAVGNRGGVGAVRSAFGGMIHPGRAKGGLIHPLPGFPYSSGFGPRAGGFHNGLDIAAPTGATIRSAGAGTVESAGWSDYGGGNQVIVNHANGLQTWYAHMSQILTKTGAKVRAGATLGKVGSTGNSTGPHLHYMVLNNGWPNYVNPMPFLGGGGAAPGGQAGGGGWNPLGDMIDGLTGWATGKFKDAFPGSDMFVDMASGLMKQGVDDAVKWAKSLIGIDSVGNTGKPLLYDNGGWLKPGLSMVENRTGRPEPIMNPSQWDAVSRGGMGGFPSVVRLRVGDREFDAYVEELADGRVSTALSAAVPRRLNDALGVR